MKLTSIAILVMTIGIQRAAILTLLIIEKDFTEGSSEKKLNVKLVMISDSNLFEQIELNDSIDSYSDEDYRIMNNNELKVKGEIVFEGGQNSFDFENEPVKKSNKLEFYHLLETYPNCQKDTSLKAEMQLIQVKKGVLPIKVIFKCQAGELSSSNALKKKTFLVV
jgi:hypothetical protein